MSEGLRHLSEYDTGTRHRATVVSSERITPAESDEVREIVLDIDREDFSYELGQSIGIVVPGEASFGHEHHFRLYSVADLPERGPGGRPRIKICVRRCSYVDEYSGERYPGVASNFLCDLAPGASFQVNGPFGPAFEVPPDPETNLILIGSGTGIAPFRAFVKHLYATVPDWKGNIWLFHGARTGLDMLYRNDEVDDFTQYYDRETFEAFDALSPRPGWDAPISWIAAMSQRGEELWEMLGDPRTRVYVAGLEKTVEQLNAVFSRLAGSEAEWSRRKAELVAGGRWVELVY